MATNSEVKCGVPDGEAVISLDGPVISWIQLARKEHAQSTRTVRSTVVRFGINALVFREVALVHGSGT